MKTLTKYLNEKLIIKQKNTNVYKLEELFDNINFKHVNSYTLETNTVETNTDIFRIMVDYIRDNDIKSFSDFDSYRNTCRENNNVCLAVFNKRIKEIDIFQKISNDNYKVFIIFKHYDIYIFKRVEQRLISMHVLRNSNTWNNADDVEYYEISEETFNDISELYNELIKK